jgi:purine nucleoside permease
MMFKKSNLFLLMIYLKRPFGTSKPGDKQASGSFYGSEVYEINANLLKKVLYIANSTKLPDTPQAIAYRKIDRCE